jgi:hypothetical protein
MPRGRRPAGARALTGAERMRHYRDRHADNTPLRVRWRRPADRRSRAQRRHDAVTELPTVQDEYASWLDTMPDSLHASATSEALQAIVDLDLRELAAIEPPRGYGRD